jgi:hypothetical protein
LQEAEGVLSSAGFSGSGAQGVLGVDVSEELALIVTK